MNQPRQLKSDKKVSLPLILMTIFLFMSLSFGLGYKASQGDWLKPAIANKDNASLPADLDYSSVERVYDALRADFDGALDYDTLIDGLKKGLAEASGDDYTVYFNATEREQFYSSLNGSFEGIGAELGTKDNVVVIIAPLKGFPAEAADLRPQDAIIKIDGEDAVGITVEEAVTKIRGEAGTDVTLTIVRDGQQLEKVITRATITIPSVEWKYLNDGKIGYLQVSRFAEDTSSLALKAANEFKDKNVESVILDLRSDSGGFVDAAVNVASLWLDRQVVFEQHVGDKVENVYKANGAPLLNGLQTIILIDGGSASASEIVSGALKDNGVATIVGTQSYGKGSVQKLKDFNDGSTLKVTIAKWFTPDGININKEGITPDEIVEFTEADFKNGTDPQLDKAVEMLTK